MAEEFDPSLKRKKAIAALSGLQGLKKRSSLFTQLIGEEGSGSRRACLQLAKRNQKMIWISAEWRIYAPLLWKLAENKNIQLLGLECSSVKKRRQLWKELFESRVFNSWVLDQLNLKEAEVAFLHQLLAKTSTQVYLLDQKPHNLCQERIHVNISHLHYKLQWSKGNQHRTQYFPLEYFSFVRGLECLP